MTNTNNTKRFWRVQPRGLGIEHYSETSNGELADGLHVLDDASQTFNLDCGESLRAVKRSYGDEIVEIESPSSWSNGDVEGVCVDPKVSKVVARFSWAQWIGWVLGREVSRATESTFAAAKKIMEAR